MQQLQQPPQRQFAAQPDVTGAIWNPGGEGYQLEATALTQMKWLSFSQVVIGGLCILLGIILIPVETSMYMYYGEFSTIGHGIWCGAFFVIVGGVGLGAFAHNTIGWIAATLVLNIVSSILFSPLLASLASIDLADNISVGCETDISSFCSAINFVVGLNILLVLVSIAEFAITIWSAVLCCQVICNCCLPVSPNRNVQDGYSALLTQGQNVDFPALVPDYQINTRGYQATAAAPAVVHIRPPSG
ncbi:membrane-spanning 4-domains subfamily A member 4A-like [Watersipora subatra]|uniref:membrane-spanning 4-domains subfamily A member 4A-like n=1 Tax=Watersipora subatra TaxID=2589382 RepID=UPI00355B458A